MFSSRYHERVHACVHTVLLVAERHRQVWCSECDSNGGLRKAENGTSTATGCSDPSERSRGGTATGLVRVDACHQTSTLRSVLQSTQLLPPELWLFILRFILRSDWSVCALAKCPLTRTSAVSVCCLRPSLSLFIFFSSRARVLSHVSFMRACAYVCAYACVLNTCCTWPTQVCHI